MLGSLPNVSKLDSEHEDEKRGASNSIHSQSRTSGVVIHPQSRTSGVVIPSCGVVILPSWLVYFALPPALAAGTSLPWRT